MPIRPTFTSGDVLTAANMTTVSNAIVAMNNQTGTSYTLAVGDVGDIVRCSNAASITVTIPASTFAIGDQINVMQYGAGQITFSPAATVTMRSSGSKTKTFGQYSVATLINIAANEWVLVGNIAS
tara:strand:+ start:8826 stop:9200 length:375 start_codon:yes stop_codon:yes gene_type:complete